MHRWNVRVLLQLYPRAAPVFPLCRFDVCNGVWADAAGTSPILAIAIAVGIFAVLRQLCIVFDAALTWSVLRDASAIAQAAALQDARDTASSAGGKTRLESVNIEWSLGAYVRALFGSSQGATLWELQHAHGHINEGANGMSGGGGYRAPGTDATELQSISGSPADASIAGQLDAPVRRRAIIISPSRPSRAAAADGREGAGLSMAQAAAAVQIAREGADSSSAALLGEGAQEIAPRAAGDPPKPSLALGSTALISVPAVVPRVAVPPVAPQQPQRKQTHAAVVPRDETPLGAATRRTLEAARRVSPLLLFDALGATPWPLIATVANALCVAFACWTFAVGEVAGYGGRAVLSIGTGLLWISLLQYFKFDGNYYLLGRTLSLSAPMMAWTVLGAIPVYLAFATSACVLFGGINERFDGLPRSAISLFAIANGDVVRETFIVSLAYEPNWIWGAVSQSEWLHL